MLNTKLELVEVLASFILIIIQGNFVTSQNCTNIQFECNNGNCILFDQFCDNYDDCLDGSDEIRHVTGFKCPIGRDSQACHLPERYLTDSVAQCSDRSDLCYVNDVFKCHKCVTSGTIISSSQLCDGVIDCPDASDECLCELKTTTNVCNSILPGAQLQCDNVTRIPLNKVCDGIIDCLNTKDEMYCRKGPIGNKIIRCSGNVENTTNILAVACNGVPECFDFSDECSSSCQVQPSFCSIPTLLNKTDQLSYQCLSSTNLNITFTVLDVCNGVWSDCYPQILNEEMDCPLRFYCQTKNGNAISIPMYKVCDGIADCNNGSDELKCPSRFYCESDLPISVPSTYLRDGVNDCADSSDECPQFLDDNVYYSRHEMLRSIPLRIWLWFIATVGLGFNVALFVYNLKKLLKLGPDKSIAKSNYFLVLNLNVADAFMAIYLLFLAIKTAEYSGIYCYVELEWRSGFSCAFMGSFSILASEATLLTLVVMTTQRLYSTYNPIEASFFKMSWVIIGMALVWVVSIVLAAVPAMDTTIFVEGVWLPTKYILQSIVRFPVLAELSRNLIYILEPANQTVFFLNQHPKDYLTNAQIPQLQIMGQYGFHSENALCVPHFYVPIGDNGWFYPTLLVTLNLFLFIYIAIAYYLIYRATSKNNIQSSRSNKHIKNMQRKMAKIVLTNILRWLPICVASYVQFGFATEFSHHLFIATALFLFPINCLLDPLQYSDAFKKLWKKIKFFVRGGRYSTENSNNQKTISSNL